MSKNLFKTTVRLTMAKSGMDFYSLPSLVDKAVRYATGAASSSITKLSDTTGEVGFLTPSRADADAVVAAMTSTDVSVSHRTTN